MAQNDLILLGGLGIAAYLLLKNRGTDTDGGGFSGLYTPSPSNGLDDTPGVPFMAMPTPTVVNQGVPRVVSVPRSSSRGSYAINRANSGGVVSIPNADQAPSIVRINSQAAVAEQLGLPRTLYSIAQPGQASIIQSLLRRR